MSEQSIQLETVNVRVADGGATIELNRPHALNAWNGQFGDDLLAAPAVGSPRARISRTSAAAMSRRRDARMCTRR
jgi:hypothetical protein